MEDILKHIEEMTCDCSRCGHDVNLKWVQHVLMGYQCHVRYGAEEKDCPYKAKGTHDPVGDQAGAWKHGVILAKQDAENRRHKHSIEVVGSDNESYDLIVNGKRVGLHTQFSAANTLRYWLLAHVVEIRP